MNKNFIIVLTLFISCNSNIINSNNEEIIYNPEISIKKGDENIWTEELPAKHIYVLPLNNKIKKRVLKDI